MGNVENRKGGFMDRQQKKQIVRVVHRLAREAHRALEKCEHLLAQAIEAESCGDSLRAWSLFAKATSEEALCLGKMFAVEAHSFFLQNGGYDEEE